jgi:hypothetical protein
MTFDISKPLKKRWYSSLFHEELLPLKSFDLQTVSDIPIKYAIEEGAIPRKKELSLYITTEETVVHPKGSIIIAGEIEEGRPYAVWMNDEALAEIKERQKRGREVYFRETWKEAVSNPAKLPESIRDDLEPIEKTFESITHAPKPIVRNQRKIKSKKMGRFFARKSESINDKQLWFLYQHKDQIDIRQAKSAAALTISHAHPIQSKEQSVELHPPMEVIRNRRTMPAHKMGRFFKLKSHGMNEKKIRNLYDRIHDTRERNGYHDSSTLIQHTHPLSHSSQATLKPRSTGDTEVHPPRTMARSKKNLQPQKMGRFLKRKAYSMNPKQVRYLYTRMQQPEPSLSSIENGDVSSFLEYVAHETPYPGKVQKSVQQEKPIEPIDRSKPEPTGDEIASPPRKIRRSERNLQPQKMGRFFKRKAHSMNQKSFEYLYIRMNRLDEAPLSVEPVDPASSIHEETIIVKQSSDERTASKEVTNPPRKIHRSERNLQPQKMGRFFKRKAHSMNQKQFEYLYIRMNRLDDTHDSIENETTTVFLDYVAIESSKSVSQLYLQSSIDAVELEATDLNHETTPSRGEIPRPDKTTVQTDRFENEIQGNDRSIVDNKAVTKEKHENFPVAELPYHFRLNLPQNEYGKYQSAKRPRVISRYQSNKQNYIRQCLQRLQRKNANTIQADLDFLLRKKK